MGVIRLFTEISKDDVALAGGKGASLSEMTRAGIPVPPGFVLLAPAFDAFLKETDLGVEIDSILHTVNHQEMHTVEDASEKIQGLILATGMPKDIADEIERQFRELGAEFVAVRSSATAEDSSTAAWAGQLESFLNTTHENLLENVKKCWASLFTPRAIFYRFEKGLHNDYVSVAVVVQKMVASETSGIAFSVHPVTEDYNQLIIEAGYGLGEAIVSGQITPDSYVVEKEPRRIIDKNISSQGRGLYRVEDGERGRTTPNEWKDIPKHLDDAQVLSDEQILELSEIILRIENHYGFPCDIEWAREGGKFYVVQSRPITTLTNVHPTSKVADPFRYILSTAKQFTWRKDWEGMFTILPCHASCTPYFHEFREIVGVNIPHLITIHKEGFASCFIAKEDEAKFGNKLASRAQQNPMVLKEWADGANTEYDKLRALMELSPEDLLVEARLSDFIKRMRMFTAYLGAMKYVMNFLDKEFLDQHASPIFEARKYTEKLFFDLEHTVDAIGEYISSKKKCGPELVTAMITPEIIQYAKDGTLPDAEMLHKRYQQSAFLYEEDVTELVGGGVATIEDAIYGQSSGILTGATAYPGKVSGVVRVITDFEKQKHDFQEGEILVTGMTNPNYLPLMKKAKAIVTDAGGVLSHAAIVSRELKVPCIIGTERATRVLEDGDMVEVDADKGVVRILEKQ